jgi:hypothetical protein
MRDVSITAFANCSISVSIGVTDIEHGFSRLVRVPFLTRVELAMFLQESS